MAVYETYYGCRQEPFSLSPDPGFLFAAAPHREALAQLRYLIQERKGFAVITGEVGTGKTMLLRAVMEDVGPKVQTGYVFNPPRTRQELYDAIADELGLQLDDRSNPARELNRYFLSTYEAGGTVVLIFDEAQALSIELLEEIRLLTNIETPRAKLVQVILAGQTELDALIDSTELRALRQRLVFRYSLGALGRADAVGYIAARMAAAGAKNSPFTLGACDAVHRFSTGIPRLINVICDNAMLSAYAIDSNTIDEEQIDEVALDLKLVNLPLRRNESRRPLAAIKPPAAETQPLLSPSRPRSLTQEPLTAVKGVGVPAHSLAPSARLDFEQPFSAPEVAAATQPISPLRRANSQERLVTLDESSAVTQPVRRLQPVVSERPLLTLVEEPVAERSRGFAFLVAFAIALLVVAIGIGTLAILEKSPDGSVWGTIQQYVYRLDGVDRSFARSVELSAL
jgi:type II secretory pathway predicted ATPase ExeA